MSIDPLLYVVKFYKGMESNFEECIDSYLYLKNVGKLYLIKNMVYISEVEDFYMGIITKELEVCTENKEIPDEKMEKIIAETLGLLAQTVWGTKKGGKYDAETFCTNFRLLQEKGYLHYIKDFFLKYSEEEDIINLATTLVERELIISQT